MLTNTESSIDFSPLAAALGGPVVPAGAEGYDSARQAWALTADQRPAAVAYATSPEDVAAAVRFARANGLHLAMQGTGHGALALGPLDDTLLLKTVRMAALEIDVAGRRARAEAGVLWGDVAVAAGAEGLAALHGSAPDTGVVGYTLGGGVGWLGRRHGLAANSVLAIEAVTADGELVRADAGNEPELFWALRGGGGAFAAVTAIEFSLVPLTEVYAGWLVYDAADAPAALAAYRDWAAAAPEEITSAFRLLHLPPLPEVPEPLRDRPVAVFDGAFLGSADDAARLLAPLRDCAPLVMDTFAPLPAAGLVHLHGDPEQPVPALGDGFLLRELTAEAVDALLDVAGPGSGSPLLSLELRQLGGALARAPEGAGALAAIDAEFALYAVGMPMAGDHAEAIAQRIERVTEALAPWAGGRYLNFADRGSDTAESFEADAYARLREIKARYDASDLFRSNHPVEPGN
jgi:FAD/FMN-containing dehydrogenase